MQNNDLNNHLTHISPNFRFLVKGGNNELETSNIIIIGSLAIVYIVEIKLNEI